MMWWDRRTYANLAEADQVPKMFHEVRIATYQAQAQAEAQTAFHPVAL